MYTYTITETQGNTAGVTYDVNPVVLKVTVVDENGVLKRIVSLRKGNTKLSEGDNAFTNTYRAGTLDISKKVTGNLGDKNKYFAFDVTLNGQSGKNTAKSFSVGKTSYEKILKLLQLVKKQHFILNMMKLLILRICIWINLHSRRA